MPWTRTVHALLLHVWLPLHATCLVCAVPADFLYDLAQDAELAWRAAGSDWDEPEDADGEAGDGTVSMAEVAASIRQGER